MVAHASAPSFTWDGGGANGNWSTAANWTSDTNPGSPQKTFHFAGTSNLNAVNDFANYSPGNQIFFDVGAGAFTLSGNAINFYDWAGDTARIVNNSSNLQTITFQTDVSNLTTNFVAVNGDLLFSDSASKAIYLDNSTGLTAIANAGKKITISQSINNGGGGSVGRLLVGGTLEGADGTGTVILDRPNTYTGTTTISSGATLQIGSGGTTGSLSASSAINNDGTLVFKRNNTVTQGADFAGVIAGSGGVTQAGAGVLLFSGTSANTYTGMTTVSGGPGNGSTTFLDLQKTPGVNAIAGNVTLGGGIGATGSGGVLRLQASNQIADTSIIYLDGNVTNSRGGLRLNGFSETVGGLVSLNTGGGLVDNFVSSTNGVLNINVASGQTYDFSGQIRDQGGTLALIKSGSGTQIISSSSPLGNNSYTGVTQINGGTLQVGNSLALGSSGNISFGGGTLRYTSGSASGTDYSGRIKSSGSAINLDTNGQIVTMAGTIDNSNTAGLTKLGAGTLVLADANTYTGTTTITTGTLQIGNGGSTGSLSSSSGIVNNGSLVFNRSNTVTQGTDFTGSPISGSGSITQNGSGKLVLWSSNTFTGGVTVNSGTLGVFEGSSLGQLPGSPVVQLTFAGNSTLQFQQTPNNFYNGNRRFAINAGITATIDTQGYSAGLDGIISGATGALAKTGNGMLTLNGANTYGGGTTIGAGTLVMGNASALGSAAAALALSGGTVNPGGLRGANLNLNSFSTTAATLTTLSQSSFTGFNLGSNSLTVSGAANVSGTTYIGINNATSAAAGTYNLINAAGGGLAGTFQFTGAQDLSVPVSSIIAKTGSGYSRLTLQNTGTALRVVVSNDVPANTLNFMPMGASIMFGSSATGTAKNGDVITSYNGGGYHTQLYQNMVNDGRFNPNFLGSQTGLGSINASGTNLLTTVGQTASEGHPGYRTSQVLYNLNHNDGSSSANGGFWLAPGNGKNPDFIPLNVGGNDFVLNPTDTNAIKRFDAILSEVASLRSEATTITTSLMYRVDAAGAAANTYFNPNLPEVVFNHVLAGHNIRFLDLYTLFTPGNSQAILSSDGVHPTQAGYNQMADAIYQSTVYGAAYWKGGQDGSWNTVNGSNTNWAMDRAGAIDRGKTLTDPTTTGVTRADVYFNNNSGALATTVDADTTVRSLNFASGSTGAVSIGGTGALSIAAGGIAVQQGTGTHTLSANVTLAADQTWGNVSNNNFTVSGNIGGSGDLTITGSYTIQTAGAFTPGAGGDTSLEVVATNTTTYTGNGTITLGGNNTYTGTTTVRSGTLIVNGNISTSPLTTVADGGTLGGSGTVGTTTVLSGGTFAPGNSPGTMTFTGDLGLNSGSEAEFEINAFTLGNFDLASAAVAGTQTVTFNGGILNLLFQAGFNTTGSVKIFDFDVYAGSGFTSVTSSGLASGYEATFDSATGIVTVIPEPRAALIGGLGLLVLLRRRRTQHIFR